MIKTFAMILLGLLLTSGVMAQEYLKNWNEGKLTWNDFSEREGSQEISELKYFLGYDTEKQRYGDTVALRYVAKGFINRKLSWINPGFKTEQYLRYNQVIFDIVEIYRRRLQYELDRINSMYQIEGKCDRIYGLCNNEIDKFNRESGGGQDMNSIIFWEQKTSDELAIYKGIKIPEYKTCNFGYALHAGFGSGIFTGSLGEHFSPTFNFLFGFDFAYKNTVLYLNGTLAGDKVKNDYLSDQNWYNGQNANVAIIDLSCGYAFIDNNRIKLSPFAGFGITELSGENRDDSETGLRIVDYNMIFGLNIDYKIKTRLNLIPVSYFGAKEKTETSVRARLYITKASYSDDLKGYSINLTLGLCGFGNQIKLK